MRGGEKVSQSHADYGEREPRGRLRAGSVKSRQAVRRNRSLVPRRQFGRVSAAVLAVRYGTLH